MESRAPDTKGEALAGADLRTTETRENRKFPPAVLRAPDAKDDKAREGRRRPVHGHQVDRARSTRKRRQAGSRKKAGHQGSE